MAVWRRFTGADLAGAASWVGLLVALGYFVGRVTAVVVALVVWGQRRFERR